MKKIKAKHSTICQNKDGIFNYFGWPSVATLQDGSLAMVASGFRVGHVCPYGKVVMCRSYDGGETWSAPSVFIDTMLDDRDGGIAVFGDNGVIITTFTLSMEFQYHNNDISRPKGPLYYTIRCFLDSMDAEKANKYQGSLYRISKDGGKTFGDIKKAPVSSPHGPCPTNDGGLFYMGTIMEPTKLVSEEDDYPQIACYISNDKNEFNFLSKLDDLIDEGGQYHISEPHAIVLPSGKIIAHIRTERWGEHRQVATLFQTESYDGGKTFTKLHKIIDAGAPAHLFLHSSGVIISSYGYRENPFEIRVMFSKDEGETWDTDYVLRDDGESWDLGYASTAELDDGSLLTVYYQHEKDCSNAVIMQSKWKLPKEVL